MIGREGTFSEGYVLNELVGVGTFSEVYRAEHRDYSGEVAFKIAQAVTPGVKTQAYLQTFQAQHLYHPHILHVHCVGVTTDGTLFYVMDYAANGSWYQQYPKNSRLPLAQVCVYAQQLAAALQYAHELGIRHGDVRPHNIFFGYNRELLLSDFCQDTFFHSEDAYDAQLLASAIAYQAPEQLRGEAQYASDQYALATVIYEWLCGVTPFQGTQWEIVAQQLMEEPAPLRTVIPELSTGVEQVILRALAKNPADRYPSILSFVMALHQASETMRASFTTEVYLSVPSISLLQRHVQVHSLVSNELVPWPESQPLGGSGWYRQDNNVLVSDIGATTSDLLTSVEARDCLDEPDSEPLLAIPPLLKLPQKTPAPSVTPAWPITSIQVYTQPAVGIPGTEGGTTMTAGIIDKAHTYWVQSEKIVFAVLVILIMLSLCSLLLLAHG